MSDTDAAIENIESMLKQEGVLENAGEQSTKTENETEGRNENAHEETREEKNEEGILSSLEQLASDHGWNPKGEKSAEEYVKVALDKFPEQSKKIKQLFRTVDELKDHMRKSEELIYERAKKELEDQRKTAVERGDHEMIEQIDKRKEELVPLAESKPLAVLDFEERHKEWLGSSNFEELEMKSWLLQRDKELSSMKLSPDEHMKVLEDHLYKKFPSYFKAETPKPAVESSSDNVAGKRSSKKKFTFNDLTSDQKRIARDFKQMGIMEIDDYIKDLVKNGDLK